MAWLEKQIAAPFERQPIDGLFFLDGDVLARAVGRDWTRGQKYARIAFPSGVKCDLWAGRDNPIVHLFGEMDLSLEATRDEAFEQAFDIGEQCGYMVAPLGKERLQLSSYEDHLLVTYNNQKRMMVNVEAVKQFFSLGQVVATPGALETLEEAGTDPQEFLMRHQGGDWGDLSDEDKKENELSLKEGFRILSAYRLDSGEKLWVITEADRSVTTLLRPSEY